MSPRKIGASWRERACGRLSRAGFLLLLAHPGNPFAHMLHDVEAAEHHLLLGLRRMKNQFFQSSKKEQGRYNPLKNEQHRS